MPSPRFQHGFANDVFISYTREARRSTKPCSIRLIQEKRMSSGAARRTILAVGVALMGASVTTQQLPPGFVDPGPVLAAAANAIGTNSLKCVTIAGTAYAGAVGQQRESARNVDWPRFGELENYVRTMDWERRSMKEEFDRKPGLNPASWKYGVRWIDGPLQQHQHQTFAVSGDHAWHVDGPGAPVASMPDLAEIYQLDMWLNPHGFLKAARLPGANPKAVWRWELGEMGRDGPEVSPGKVTVVSITVNGKFRVDATINKENMLQRIHTWVDDPVLGDMNYEHEFSNASYVDLGNGIRFPTEWHSHQGWDDNYGTQAASAGHNAFGGTLKNIRPNHCPDALPVPPSIQQATFPVRVETSKLAEGVYLLGGGTHNSVAIEFRDFIAVFEAPLDEQRSLAVIEEIVRLIPGKPIRWLINSHQHFDHAGGLRAYMHIGATIVTHVKNFDFYLRDVLNYAPRTLKPDMVSLWPPTELAEGYYYEAIRENFIISDGVRNLNVHYVNPLQHVEGMLIAFLPKEGLLFEADLVGTNQARGAPPTADQRSFRNAVGKLKLSVSQVVPVHGTPVSWSALRW
jgi:glyoxylase-like metal-dependent hydrolase (beta-lactamase superfamily II)